MPNTVRTGDRLATDPASTLAPHIMSSQESKCMEGRSIDDGTMEGGEQILSEDGNPEGNRSQTRGCLAHSVCCPQ